VGSSKRQNERLDQFASVISHDLRNPLNIVQLRLTLLADECNSDHIEPTERALDRIESIVEGTLTLARQCWAMVETGEATLDVVDDVTVEGDPDRLRNVFENLLRNAVEHGDDVRITIGRLGEAAADGFYVADDGPGIRPEDRNPLFDTGYSTAQEGTGFGLCIVEEIASAHDWTVDVTESETGGARFEFRVE
jgi:signal transduction histidine kinase